jgi:hypothetical protein
MRLLMTQASAWRSVGELAPRALHGPGAAIAHGSTQRREMPGLAVVNNTKPESEST